MLLDGVHFDLSQCEAQQAGYKTLAVNLSDLAAMAAEPTYALVSMALPHERAAQLAKDVTEGILELASQFNVALIGGDTNTWNGPLAINVVVGGAVQDQAWTRKGAQPGDWILATGEFGGSILGHHLGFTPRLHAARSLVANYQISSATDVSDGLALDLSHICTASGCGAVLLSNQIPVSPAAQLLANASNRTPLDHALADGEDFELIFTAAEAEAQRVLTDQPCGEAPVTHIGVITECPDLWLDHGTRRELLPPRGYEHGGPS